MKTPGEPVANNEIAHYNAVLIEGLHSKMDLVVEGMLSTKKELKRDISEFRCEVNQRFELVELAIKHHSSEIKELKTDVKELKTDVKELKTDVKELKTSVKNLEAKVDKLDTKVDKIGGRLDKVEKRVDNHDVVLAT